MPEVRPEEWVLAYATAFAYARYTHTGEHPIRRTIERVRLRHGSYTRSIKMDLVLPSAREVVPDFADDVEAAFLTIGHALVPATVTRRGATLSGYQVFDSAGQPADLLPGSDARELVARILEVAWEAAWHGAGHGGAVRAVPEAGTPGPGGRSGVPLERIHRQIQEIPWADPTEAQEIARGVVEQIGDLSAVRAADLAHADLIAYQRLLALVQFFAERTIVWAKLTARPGSMVSFSYHYDDPLRLTDSPRAATQRRKRRLEDLRARGWPRRAWRLVVVLETVVRAAGDDRECVDLVREWLGYPPNSVFLPVGAVQVSESYHFHLDAPESSFVAGQRLVVVDRERPDDAPVALHDVCGDQLADGSDYQGHDDSANHRVHFYTHRIRTARGRPVYASVDFLERPPGATGAALALGVCMALLCLFSAVTFPLLLELSNSSVDVVAIMLTVPVFASVWLGRAVASEPDSYARAPLIARGGIVVFGVVPVLSALTMMLTMALHVAAVAAAEAAANAGGDAAAQQAAAAAATTAEFVARWLLVAYCAPVLWLVWRLYQQRKKLMANFFRPVPTTAF